MRTFHLRRLLGAVALAVAGLVLVMGAQAADSLLAKTVSVDIPAQQLTSALISLSKQAEIQVLMSSDVVDGLRTQGVRGEMALGDAIAELLQGTQLGFRSAGVNTVGVGRADVATGEGNAASNAERPSTVRLAEADTSASAAKAGEGLGTDEAPQDSSGEETQKLEEIVVTAQKREERLQDVPISISVLDGEALDRSSFMSVNDALRTVPGIAMYENGQAGMSKIAVRGVASNTSLFNGSSVVSYYLDEIPFAFVRYPVTPDAGSFDLQRVEALRGPQGTLYGASSLNGVIRILTEDANLDEVEFKARTALSSTRGGGENYRADAALNVPLVPGKLAVRGVLGYADNSGWIDLPIPGLKDVNDGKQKTARLKVNAAPVESLDIEFLGWFSRDERGSSPVAFDDSTLNTRFPQVVEDDYDAYGLTLTYDFPRVSLLSATSHMTLTGSSLLDAPLGVERLTTIIGSKLTSQELRLTSRGAGPWRWSLGGIYRDAEDRRFQEQEAKRTFRGVGDNRFASESFALFGEVSRALLDDRLELTGGLRYFEDRSSSNELAAQTPVANPTDFVPVGKKRDKFDSVTPRVVVTYHPSADTSLYASYSQGFRSGFSQIGDVLRLTSGAAPAVKPDKLTNYELGAKGSAIEDRLSYDFSVYYADWKDAVQALTNIVNGSGFFGAINSKGIDGFGVDLAAAWRFSSRLELGATVSWNGLEFVDNVFSGATVQNPIGNLQYPKGDRPPESSELTAGGALSYTIALAGEYSGRFTGAVDYISKLQTPGATAASAQQGDNLVIARTSFSLTAPKGWSAMLFVDNLGDEDGKIRPVPITTPAQLGQSDRLRPRTYGLQLDYRFD